MLQVQGEAGWRVLGKDGKGFSIVRRGLSMNRCAGLAGRRGLG